MVRPTPASHIPSTNGNIVRPRLLEKLNAVLDHRLTIVSAPPGYGKTTVVAQFAHQVDCPVAWHTIDERQRDVPNLYARCLAVLDPIIPGIQTPAAIIGRPPNEVAALITDAISDSRLQKMIYILDDVHHLAPSPAAEAWLYALVELLPTNCHLMLLSRIWPNVPTAEMIVRREVLAIGQDDLRLTSDEIQALAQTVQGDAPAPDVIDDLAKRLEGWPAGTVIALRPLHQDLEQSLLQSGKAPEALFDALAASMLRTQPLGLRNFLLASSTLKRLTPETCTAVLKMPNGLAHFQEIQDRNLFAVRVAGGLVYHSLFREFLQHELQASQPQLFVELHHRAAEWFEENDSLDDAFDHYMAAGFVQEAARIAEYVAHSYFGQGKVETLLEWGATLDGYQAPRLLYTCAMIRTDRYDYVQAEADLSAAERGFSLSHDEDGLYGVAFQRTMILLLRADYQNAIQSAQSLLDRLPDNLINLRGRAMRTIALAHLRRGELETGLRFLVDALPVYRQEGDKYALSLILQDFAFAYSLLGQVEEARACLQEVVALARELGSQGTLAMALNNLGYFYYRSTDYTQALATLYEGWGVAAQVRDKRSESYLLGSLGDLYRDWGNYTEAFDYYDKAIASMGNSEPALQCAVWTSFSVMQRWRENYHEAVVLAEAALSLAESHHLALEVISASVAIWSARACLDEAPAALTKLHQAADDFRQRGAKIELITALAQCANVALLCDDTLAARRYIAEAFEVATRIGCMQPLAAEINHHADVEALLTEDPNYFEPLLHDLKRLREDAEPDTPLKPGRTSKVPTRTTYSLRLRTLGAEAIERDGELIASAEWHGPIARDLFFYLYFVGPSTKDQLGNVFWPDKSPEGVRSILHVSVHRARHALGENVILYTDGIYHVNSAVEINCDALRMEKLARRARVLPPRDALTEDLWHKAVSLYQGDFLPALDTDWVMAQRQSYRETYIAALMGLAECARARRDIRRAIQCLKEALSEDPYREEILRAIMTCFAELGERKQVFDHLEEFRRRLWDELETDPSQETLDLAQILLS